MWSKGLEKQGSGPWAETFQRMNFDRYLSREMSFRVWWEDRTRQLQWNLPHLASKNCCLTVFFSHSWPYTPAQEWTYTLKRASVLTFPSSAFKNRIPCETHNQLCWWLHMWVKYMRNMSLHTVVLRYLVWRPNYSCNSWKAKWKWVLLSLCFRPRVDRDLLCLSASLAALWLVWEHLR